MKNHLIALLESLIQLLSHNKTKRNTNKLAAVSDNLKPAAGGLECLNPKSDKRLTGIFC